MAADLWKKSNALLIFLHSLFLLQSIKSQCSNSPSIENSREITEEIISDGQEVDIECKTGYNLIGDSSLTCTLDDNEDYVWKGKNFPRCIENSWNKVELNLTQTGELFQFDPLSQIIQLQFLENILLPTFRLWCNMNFHVAGDSSTAHSFSRILFNFEKSKIVDSVVEYGRNNVIRNGDQNPCQFCLDFSVPNNKVPEVVTYHFPDEIYYDGILGRPICEKDIWNKWTELMSGDSIKSFSHQCFFNDMDSGKEENQQAFTLWMRILPIENSDLYCDSGPDIENAFVELSKFPIRIGTVVTVKCTDGYDQSGSSVGTCSGFKNKYKFSLQPYCTTKESFEKDEGFEENESDKYDEENKKIELEEAKIMRKEHAKTKIIGNDSEGNDDLAWHISMILYCSLFSMSVYCAVLMKQLNYFKMTTAWICPYLTSCVRLMRLSKESRETE